MSRCAVSSKCLRRCSSESPRGRPGPRRDAAVEVAKLSFAKDMERVSAKAVKDERLSLEHRDAPQDMHIPNNAHVSSVIAIGGARS
jgi:hypothetical protein